MATKAQRVRLALFFVVSGGVLALFLIILGGAHLLEEREKYLIEFAGISVGGLRKGSKVKYQGIDVGRVERTYISAADLTTVVVEITVEVDKVPSVIRVDTEASLHTQGITGIKYVELIAGTADAALLPPGSRIRANDSFLANLEERADLLTQKVEHTLNNVIQLTGGENRRNFSRFLSNGGDFMATANELATENRTSLNRTFENLAKMTESLASATATFAATMQSVHGLVAGEGLASAATDLQVSARQLRLQMEGPVPELIANLNETVKKANLAFSHVDRTVVQSRSNILRAMQDLEETLQNIRQTSEVIRENPSVLIRGRQ
jgi:phospholipid/cholesterol/gamma-HCH transport system substrate-binding protein